MDTLAGHLDEEQAQLRDHLHGLVLLGNERSTIANQARENQSVVRPRGPGWCRGGTPASAVRGRERAADMSVVNERKG